MAGEKRAECVSPSCWYTASANGKTAAVPSCGTPRKLAVHCCQAELQWISEEQDPQSCCAQAHRRVDMTLTLQQSCPSYGSNSEVWTRLKARRKPQWFNGHDGGSASRCGARTGHSGTHQPLWPSTASDPISSRLDTVLPLGLDRQGRESEADDLRNSPSL